jgi:hypothetical protein
MKWAVPLDDYRTRWFSVDFYPLGENGEASSQAVQAMNDPGPHIGYAVGLPDDWVDQVGAWWNLGHPWRQGNLWEDEVAQRTQGPPERHYLPDWEKWHPGTSDRGMLLNREVWREQIDRVQEGLDPIGVIRDPKHDRIIRVTADWIEGMDWDDAIRLYDITPEERLRMIAERDGVEYAFMERI